MKLKQNGCMQPKTPMVSIVMPLFNKEKEVGRAIQSALKQTFGDFELIVVNDGSTDDGPKIVQSFCDPRIRLIAQENAGVSAARNRGIQEAKANLIAFLDADDEWFPDFLETINRLRSSYRACSVFATNYMYRNVNGSIMPTILRGLQGPIWEGILENYFKVASNSDPPVWSSAVAVTREAINSVGGFPTNISAGEDLVTWAKLASKYSIAYSNQPAAIFYLRESLWGHPTRPPDSVDIVGQELERILDKRANTKISGLEEYIAHWHQMRASVFLRLGKRKEAIDEVKKIAKYSKRNTRLYVFFAIALLPQKICKNVLSVTNHWKYIRRKRTSP
jgi:glycosyltransferase involved in cell wall biosynthesis